MVFLYKFNAEFGIISLHAIDLQFVIFRQGRSRRYKQNKNRSGMGVRTTSDR